MDEVGMNITTAADIDSMSNLMPALVQIFLTIIVGYVAGYFAIIGQRII